MTTPKSNDNKRPNIPIKKPLNNKVVTPAITIDPLEEMRNKILKILEESNEQITSLSVKCSQIDIDYEDSTSKVHDYFSKELDEIYMMKTKELEDIHDKYAYDLFKVKEYYPINNDHLNADDIKYNAILKEKTEAIDAIEKEFEDKKTALKKEYDSRISAINNSSEENRRNVNQIQTYNEIKQKINSILNESTESPSKPIKEPSKTPRAKK